MATPEYIPLTDLEGSTLGSALSTYDLVPGRYLAERIGVDAGRLGSIALRGGFESDVHLHAYYGKASQTNVVTMGNANQNTAVAGAVRTVPAEPSRGRFVSDKTVPFRSPTHLDLMINMSAVKERVTTSRRPVREAATWAPHIDYEVRSGLQHAAWEHLVGTSPPFHELILNMVLAGASIGTSGVALDGVMHHPNFHDLTPGYVTAMYLGTVLLQGLAVDLYKAGFKKMHGQNNALRSVIPFAYVDRVARVSARTRLGRPLVVALK